MVKHVPGSGRGRAGAGGGGADPAGPTARSAPRSSPGGSRRLPAAAPGGRSDREGARGTGRHPWDPDPVPSRPAVPGAAAPGRRRGWDGIAPGAGFAPGRSIHPGSGWDAGTSASAERAFGRVFPGMAGRDAGALLQSRAQTTQTSQVLLTFFFFPIFFFPPPSLSACF